MTEEQAKYETKKPDITKELQKAKDAGANLLLPSTEIGELSDWHTPVIDKVYLSSKPDDGDVYPAGQAGQDDSGTKKFRLAAQGLRKLSVCAGLIWHPWETRRIDDMKNRDYVAFQAVGGIRKADGQPVWWKGSYDLDFEIVEEELRDQYSAKCANWDKTEEHKQAYVDRNVRRDMLFKRKHRTKLCESGAMNRVIRSILGLKNAYTVEELAKPFVMLRIVLRPDFTDKDVRAKLADTAIKAMVGIYGSETPIETPARDFSGMGDVIDVEPEKEEEPGETENVPGDEPSDREVFQSYSVQERINMLKGLASEKGYALGGEWLPLEKKSERNLVRLYDHLQALVDDDDDIPF